MRIILEPINERGKTACETLLQIKKNGNKLTKLALHKVKFNAQVLSTDPYKLEIGHVAFSKIPSLPMYEEVAKRTLEGVLIYLDCDLKDFKIETR